MINDPHIDFQIIWKKLNATITAKEAAQLDTWLNNDPRHRIWFDKAAHYYATGQVHDYQEVEGAKTIEKLLQSVSDKNQIKKEAHRWPYAQRVLASVAAAIALIIVTYIVIISVADTNGIENMHNTAVVNLTPGTSKAVLTLASGDTITLQKGNTFEMIIENTHVSGHGDGLTYAGGNATGHTQYNTLTVPRGGEFSLTLADGTKVWMNSESELKYPVAFTDGQRNVMLTGEAYFEVAQNPTQPFTVNSYGLQTTVLGTEFNITAYENEPISVTVTTGKIKVEHSEINNNFQIVQPNQQVTYDSRTKELIKKTVDTHHYTAWKEGIFSFTNEPLDDIMRTLSRWYNVEVIFENGDKKKIQFTGEVKRFDNLEKLLELLEKTHEVQFKYNANEVIIY